LSDRDCDSPGAAGELEGRAAADPGRYSVKMWGLKRTANSGSDHYNERPLAVKAAKVSEDGCTVELEIPEIAPTWCMEIRYTLRSAAGTPVNGTIHSTIHRLED
jgi:hypothetical protein